MDAHSAAESSAPGPATRADADVRAVLSALRGLSVPAEAATAPPIAPPDDRYRRVRLHAQGGLGQVWLGRDELVGRDVAIKEPRADRPGEAARTALEREAWILGRLQHPNIVPLYDLVRRPDGRVAYYVMPFLDGDGLHALAGAFHRPRPPGPATRLVLLPLLTAFLEVCAALEHAHGRGVWHLDIKGDNVKLGPAGAAVVLDWGLARLAAPTDGEPPTGAGSAGGTPAFMAPEQAEAPADRVGSHTDVYGLGALLYLLLTGRPPHPDVAGCNRDALAAALCRPVTAPRTLWSGVPAALEAICLKALAVDPGHRYAGVAALRAEVQRWLADEPVAAYRERPAERLARWGRRHRRTVTAAAAVLVTAVAALAVGLVALDREHQETDRQRRAAEAALAQERDSFRQALKAGDDYFKAVSDSPLLREPGMQPVRRALLERGLAYYQDFLARRGDEPALRAEVAGAWMQVGQIQIVAGRLPEALTAYARALRLGEELQAANPADADLRVRLARYRTAHAYALCRAGRLTEALAGLDHASALLRGLPLEQAERLRVAAWGYEIRAIALDMAGDLPGACAAEEQAMPLFARSARDAASRLNHAIALIRLGQYRRSLRRLPEAAAALREARQRLTDLHDEPGMALTIRWRSADCDHTLGLIAAAAGHGAEAAAHFEAARAARRQLAEQNPTVYSHRAELLSSCLGLAGHYISHGDRGRTVQVCREACAQADELMRHDPADFHYRRMSLRAYRLAAGSAEADGDLATAAGRCARAAELLAGAAALADGAALRAAARDAISDGVRQLCWGHWRAAVESFREADVCLRRARESVQSADQRASASRQ